VNTDLAQATVLEEGARLRAQVAHHKAMIRREREQLQRAAAALEQFAQKCRALGIEFIVQE
jgi:hypothetical protein